MAPAWRDGAGWGRQPPGAPPPPGRGEGSGLAITNRDQRASLLGKGLRLNGDGLQLDPALGLVAVATATHSHYNEAALRPTPTTTQAKTRTKRRRHAHTELAAAEQVLLNAPEAPPIMAGNPANKARNANQTIWTMQCMA
jgi:hypothetical protein